MEISQQQQQKQQQQDPTLKGVTGIQNVGNTCYCNATLQILRASPEWSAYCLSSNFEEICSNSTPKKVLIAYQDILKSLWAAYKPAYVRPTGFISAIRDAVKGTVYDMFGAPIPNDSHEYLMYLLDNFHEALKAPINIPKTDGSDMNKMAENGWGLWLSKNSSEIAKLFFGMMRKTIECTGCNSKTYQWEVFNCLKVPCEGGEFKDWIANECDVTEIEGYDCEKCKPQKQKALLYSHIWKLPHTLFLTLRRFTYDGRKCTTACPYDGNPLSFTDYFAEESTDESKGWSYELRGVVDHHGSHLGGHYTSQFKHPYTGEWWYIDDEVTQKLDKPQMTRANYIYLFRRI